MLDLQLQISNFSTSFYVYIEKKQKNLSELVWLMR